MSLLALLLLLLSLAPQARALELQVVERELGNGLRVLVHEDHSAPVVSCYVFYRSGSRNEQLGRTGMAHLFEHMMFNGGRKYGPGQFDKLIESRGGSSNGYTTRDYTAYLETLPREGLELALDLESDRMANLALTKTNLEQERGIVKEERRLRVDNNVGGRLDETLYLTAFVESPYRWNPVGFMADLNRIQIADARAYFRSYYAPNNAVLVLAGDVEPDAAFALVERYFGRIPRRPPPPLPPQAEPEQLGERRAEVHMAAELPAVLVGYHAVPATDPDRPALDVLQTVLAGGESARLYRDLVREHELATTVQVDFAWAIAPELFTIYAQARPGEKAGELEGRIEAVMRELRDQPVPEHELRKAKNQLEAGLVKGLKTVSRKANRIGFFTVVFGDYRELFVLDKGWEAVSAADVQRVARRYLTPRRRTVVTLIPEGAGVGGEDRRR